MIWIYKCNAVGHEYQSAWGDWSDFFAGGRARQWGSTESTAQLAQATPGDTIIAYQTDRNELVGLARVARWRTREKFKDLILQPLGTIGVKVRPLKKRDRRVAQTPALRPGPIRTLYPISDQDAKHLLRVAGAQLRLDPERAEREASAAVRGAGFGSSEENRQVEHAALKLVTRNLRRAGWTIRNVSTENRGYDLLCKKSAEQLHVEVKGARGAGQQFIVTANERHSWLTDPMFVLAFAGHALSKSPTLFFFAGRSAMDEFAIRPISYVAVRRPNEALERAVVKGAGRKGTPSSGGRSAPLR